MKFVMHLVIVKSTVCWVYYFKLISTKLFSSLADDGMKIYINFHVL